MKKYKVILISPPLSPEKQAGKLANIANVQPTLGIGYIAAVLLKNDFEVEIIDCYLKNYTFDQVGELIKKDKPNAIGITSTIVNIDDSLKMAEYIKKEFPKIILVVGGPQLTADIKGTFKNSSFDFGIYGEGEYAALELFQNLRSKKNNFDSILNLVWRKGKEIIINAVRPYIANLDELPQPARHLYPHINKYHPVPASYKRLPVGQMITSRGCPNQCIFCDRSVFGNKYRAHSADYVLNEIEGLIKDYGAREIRFMDDTFSLIPERVEEICQGILDRKLDITWSCLTRVDRVNPDILKKMKRAGCWQVIYGLETGDSEVLKRVKKGTTLEQAEKAVKWSKEAGLETRATFILGLPGENVETIKRTVNFAKKLDLDVVNFFTVVLYPGNELCKIAEKEGKILHKHYDQYTSLIDTDSAKLHYLPEGMEEEELKKLVSWAYHSYYLRPLFLIKKISKIKSLDDIKRYWQAFKAVINI